MNVLIVSVALSSVLLYGAAGDRRDGEVTNSPAKITNTKGEITFDRSTIDQINRIRTRTYRTSLQRKAILEGEQLQQRFDGIQQIQQHRAIQERRRQEKPRRAPELPLRWERVGVAPAMNLQPFSAGEAGTRSSRNVIDVQVNGADADTIVQGSDFVVTVTFSDSAFEADVFMWVDMDGDGILDESVDFELDEGGHIVDNDMEDEDPTVGVYQQTFYDDQEGPNRVSNLGIFYQAIDAGGEDAAFLYIEPLVSDYSVAGTVTPATANIIVAAFPAMDGDQNAEPWLTVTGADGSYEVFVPDSGWYNIAAFDFLDVTGGMLPDTIYFDVLVNGHLSGYDFVFTMPHSAIEGYVTDDSGTPLAGVWVWVDPEDGPGMGDETDSSGYFFIGVNEGEYHIGLNDDDLIPDYLVPEDSFGYVGDFDTITVDFTAYVTDSHISGTVYLDGFPYGGLFVDAWSPLGWTSTEADMNGHYLLQVASAADAFGGYNLGISGDLPPGVVMQEWPGGILSGSSEVDIHLITVAGGIEGYVYDATTMEPIDFGWVWASAGDDGFGTGTWDDGHYYLPLPNGVYDVFVGAEDYYHQEIPNVIIQDNVITMDFYLEPVEYTGSLSGYVYDAATNQGIAGAEVSVGSENFWDQVETDADGYYYLDLPNGVYHVFVQMEGYAPAWIEELVIENNAVEQDFYLQEIVINAAIEGVVFDQETGDPIVGAEVFAWSPLFATGAVSGAEGYFFMEVPSDTFWVDAGAPGYYHSEPAQVFVPAEDTVWVEFGLWPQTIQPPVIHFIGDVPNDQGRRVRIVWSPGDPSDVGGWTQFSIWRLIPNAPFPLWDFVGVVPFHGMEDYAYIATTLVDSNAYTGPTGEFWSTFMVTAHTFNPWEFYDSEPMSGYSIDNLHPHAPGGLVAAVAPGGDGVELAWHPVPDEDFDYYSVYRGTTSGFEPLDPIGYTVDTSFVDPNVTTGVTYYYVVSATDFNGNEGDYSDEVNATVLATGVEIVMPDRYELAQNYPNPFNPTTTIRYALPQSGLVSITVYNLLGKEVARLVDQVQEPGWHSVIWDASGMNSGLYLVRMQAGKQVFTRKMMLLK
jgi:hypothetical protein